MAFVHDAKEYGALTLWPRMVILKLEPCRLYKLERLDTLAFHDAMPSLMGRSRYE